MDPQLETTLDPFEVAVDHAMLYEVGSHWDACAPGVQDGRISTPQERRACGYVNDPLDRGGETKFGVARNANPDIDIMALTWDGAKRIYFRRYWLASNSDDLSLYAPRLAILHFDGAVNHGPGRAARFLQRAVGAEEDGDVGPATLEAVEAAVGADGEMSVCLRICDLREEFYRAIAARNPSQGRFLRGWLNRINAARALVSG